MTHLQMSKEDSDLRMSKEDSEVECLTNSPPVTTDRHSEPHLTGLCKGGFPLAHHSEPTKSKPSTNLGRTAL